MRAWLYSQQTMFRSKSLRIAPAIPPVATELIKQLQTVLAENKTMRKQITTLTETEIRLTRQVKELTAQLSTERAAVEELSSGIGFRGKAIDKIRASVGQLTEKCSMVAELQVKYVEMQKELESKAEACLETNETLSSRVMDLEEEVRALKQQAVEDAEQHIREIEYLDAKEDSLAKEIESLLTCTISGELMEHPFATSSGHAYDGDHIKRWLKNRKSCPMTKEYLDEGRIYPNIVLQKIRDIVCNRQ